ncbi:hypothetical protein ACT7C6_35760 [Bacillus paranthracis]
MKIIPVKVMTCAALVASLSTASFVPSYAFAAETKAAVTENKNQPNLPDKYLGPEGLQKSIRRNRITCDCVRCLCVNVIKVTSN